MSVLKTNAAVIVPDGLIVGGVANSGFGTGGSANWVTATATGIRTSTSTA